jgi:uncharacterized protein (UPF0332 family)
MIELSQTYLEKARESLDGAESEFVNRRYNNAANRCYYACFQAAVAALTQNGVRSEGQWSHSSVQASFVRELINRRKLFPSSLRDVLSVTMRLRHKADYDSDNVTEVQASRAVRRAAEFVDSIERGGEN